MARKRIIVVVNKWWECDPAMAVLLNPSASPASLSWPEALFHPHRRPDAEYSPGCVVSAPRAVFHLANADAEIWCISDLLDNLSSEYQSSTEKKAERVARVFDGVTPSLVIAVGTAGYPALETENGCVVVGGSIFLHDGHPANQPNPVSQWHEGPFNEVLVSELGRDSFESILAAASATKPAISDLLLTAPLNPSPRPTLMAAYDWVSLGSVNVTEVGEYPQQDKATVDAFTTAGYDPATARSLDTTLGLVCRKAESPFLFVAGVVNRVGFAAEEMRPRSYAQNFVGAHNAGIVLARLIAGTNEAFA